MGTITHDVIALESGLTFKEIGGVLYQAAVLCGLGKDVFLYSNLGQELVEDVEKIIEGWSTLHTGGIHHVEGPGNRVKLYYPHKGERVEILESVVPPLDHARILKAIPELGMLLLIMNSGFDVELKDWRKIVQSASCPVWIDIHSLALARKLGVPREYISLTEWKKWAEGISYLQANRQEIASMLGCPKKVISEGDVEDFGKEAFDVGLKAIFVTLGKEGGLVLTPHGSKKIASLEAETIVDTTGCGDVFCAATAVKLLEGKAPFSAASFGLELATKAVSLKGIKQTYSLALNHVDKE